MLFCLCLENSSPGLVFSAFDFGAAGLVIAYWIKYHLPLLHSIFIQFERLFGPRLGSTSDRRLPSSKGTQKCREKKTKLMKKLTHAAHRVIFVASMFSLIRYEPCTIRFPIKTTKCMLSVVSFMNLNHSLSSTRQFKEFLYYNISEVEVFVFCTVE